MPVGEVSIAASSDSDEYLPLFSLGQGGMANVEVALRREGNFQRLYATKRVKPHLLEQPRFRSRFMEEARIAGLLRHPNVVSVQLVAEDHQGPFLVMDFVPGVSLARLLQRVQVQQASIPLLCCLSFATDVARGLAHAHDLVALDGAPLRLVHRDVSPQNILVGFDGIARITDFGIAKAIDRKAVETEAGILTGKMSYLSPEQLQFLDLDQRSDYFSFGIVLYEMLSGTKMFHLDDGQNVVAKRILEEPPPDVGEVRTDVPPEVVALLFRMLAKDRAHRPAHASEIVTTLEQAQRDLLDDEPQLNTADWIQAFAADEKVELERNLRDALDRLDAKETVEIDLAEHKPGRKFPVLLLIILVFAVLGAAALAGTIIPAKNEAASADAATSVEEPAPLIEVEDQEDPRPDAEADKSTKKPKRKKRKKKKRPAKPKPQQPRERWSWE